jgi:hypothetical protein
VTNVLLDKIVKASVGFGSVVEAGLFSCIALVAIRHSKRLSSLYGKVSGLWKQ